MAEAFLGEYRWSISGSGVTMDETIVLNNPNFRVDFVNYDCESKIADIGLVCWEPGSNIRSSVVREYEVSSVEESLGRESVIAIVGAFYSAATITYSGTP